MFLIVDWGEGQSQREQALRAPRPWCGCCPVLSSPPSVSAPARLCGAAVGGRGERDHLRPEPLRWEGERRERGEGPARCLLLRATVAGAPTSSPAAPSAAKGYCRTTSLPHPPLRPGLCGRRQPSLAACGPFWVWVWVLLGPAGDGVAVTRCTSLQRAQLRCAGPCSHISLGSLESRAQACTLCLVW